jgi:hypothetical protein
VEFIFLDILVYFYLHVYYFDMSVFFVFYFHTLGITDISIVLTQECVAMNLVLCINFINRLPFCPSLVTSWGPMHLPFVQ